MDVGENDMNETNSEDDALDEVDYGSDPEFDSTLKVNRSIIKFEMLKDLKSSFHVAGMSFCWACHPS